MAAKRKTSRKSRKPKFIEIGGHKLTLAMQIDYEHCLESRKTTNAGYPIWQIEKMALDDFLAGYRPSRKIKRQLNELSLRIISAANATGTMSDYTFYSGQSPIRSAGCKLLHDLAQELTNSVATLQALASGLESEESSTLQDWLVEARALEQFGCSQEFAHGN